MSDDPILLTEENIKEFSELDPAERSELLLRWQLALLQRYKSLEQVIITQMSRAVAHPPPPPYLNCTGCTYVKKYLGRAEQIVRGARSRYDLARQKYKRWEEASRIQLFEIHQKFATLKQDVMQLERRVFPGSRKLMRIQKGSLARWKDLEQ